MRCSLKVGPLTNIDTSKAQEKDPVQSQRIDKWLWCARFFKTRTIAAKFVSQNVIRLNRDSQSLHVEKPSFLIRAGDSLSFSIGERLRLIGIIATAARRGPASEATTLYEDNSPPLPPREEKLPKNPSRAKGMGRPTKKDRRAMERFADDT